MNVITIESEAFQEIIKNIEEIKVAQTKTNSKKENEYLTNRQVANLLGCSIRSLQNYRDSGELAFFKFGKKLLYQMSDIELFLNNNYQKTF